MISSKENKTVARKTAKKENFKRVNLSKNFFQSRKMHQGNFKCGKRERN